PLAADRRRHPREPPPALRRPRRAARVGTVDVAADRLAVARSPPSPAADQDALPVPADDRADRACVVPHLRLDAPLPLLRARPSAVGPVGAQRHADRRPDHEDRRRLLPLDGDRRHLLPLVLRRRTHERRSPLLGRRRTRAQTARPLVALSCVLAVETRPTADFPPPEWV